MEERVGGTGGPDRKTRIVELHRTVYPHAYLYAAGRHALELAAAAPSGQFYSCMHAVLCAALAVEGYLNVLGSARVVGWTKIERKLSTREKLDFLLLNLKISADRGQRPFQTFSELLQRRDDLVHAKVKLLRKKEQQTLADGERPAYPEAQWELACTLDAATRFLDDAAAMIRTLHRAAKMTDDPLATLADGGHTIRG